MAFGPISTNAINEALFSLKIDKSPGYNKISYNHIKNRFGALCEPPQLAKGSSQMIQKL